MTFGWPTIFSFSSGNRGADGHNRGQMAITSTGTKDYRLKELNYQLKELLLNQETAQILILQNVHGKYCVFPHSSERLMPGLMAGDVLQIFHLPEKRSNVITNRKSTCRGTYSSVRNHKLDKAADTAY